MDAPEYGGQPQKRSATGLARSNIAQTEAEVKGRLTIFGLSTGTKKRHRGPQGPAGGPAQGLREAQPLQRGATPPIRALRPLEPPAGAAGRGGRRGEGNDTHRSKRPDTPRSALSGEEGRARNRPNDAGQYRSIDTQLRQTQHRTMGTPPKSRGAGTPRQEDAEPPPRNGRSSPGARGPALRGRSPGRVTSRARPIQIAGPGRPQAARGARTLEGWQQRASEQAAGPGRRRGRPGPSESPTLDRARTARDPEGEPRPRPPKTRTGRARRASRGSGCAPRAYCSIDQQPAQGLHRSSEHARQGSAARSPARACAPPMGARAVVVILAACLISRRLVFRALRPLATLTPAPVRACYGGSFLPLCLYLILGHYSVMARQ